MIRFENVSKTFRGNGKQVEAVKEVSLHIKKRRNLRHNRIFRGRKIHAGQVH